MRYDGHRALWLQQYDPKTKKTIGPRRVLVDGGANPATNPEHIEGPHLFKHDDWYYLTAAEGGTGEQHAQMVWRSRKVDGPYAGFPGNPTLTQRDLPGSRSNPVTSSGHAQFVKLTDGSWWAVFLATRPYRGNQYNLGRETFLLPVQWQDGWPRILPRGQSIPLLATRPALPRSSQPLPTTGPFQWRERFTSDRLPLQWMSFHPPKGDWYSTGPDGLRLKPSRVPLGAFGTVDGQPAYLGHRLQHHKATIEATLASFDAAKGELAGLALVQNEYGHYVLGIERDGDGIAVALYRRAGREGAVQGEPLVRSVLDSTRFPISLRLRIDGPRLDAAYSVAGGDWTTLSSDLDASLVSVETAGGFIGNTFGPYVVQVGSAD